MPASTQQGTTMTPEDELAEKFLDEYHRMASPVTELAKRIKEHAMQKRNGVTAFTPDQLAEYAETVREEQQKVCADAIHLPKITEDIAYDYTECVLIESHKANPQWTQTAVDFACLMKEYCLNATGESDE